MNKSEYYTLLHRLVEEDYGWEAIQDLTKMLCKEWNEARAEAREVRWQNNIVRKFASSDLPNKRKVDAIIDVLGDDEDGKKKYL